MLKIQQDAEDFLLAAGMEPRYHISRLEGDELHLRANLILEEHDELQEALVKGNEAEICKEIVDLIYVTVQAASEMGINLEPVWDAVQRSNMEKFGPGGPKRSETGKILKPDGWRVPNINWLLRQQELGLGSFSKDLM